MRLHSAVRAPTLARVAQRDGLSGHSRPRNTPGAQKRECHTHACTCSLQTLTTHEKQAPPPRSRRRLCGCRHSPSLLDTPASLGGTGDREDTDVASNANNKILIPAAAKGLENAAVLPFVCLFPSFFWRELSDGDGGRRRRRGSRRDCTDNLLSLSLITFSFSFASVGRMGALWNTSMHSCA